MGSRSKQYSKVEDVISKWTGRLDGSYGPAYLSAEYRAQIERNITEKRPRTIHTRGDVGKHGADVVATKDGQRELKGVGKGFGVKSAFSRFLGALGIGRLFGIGAAFGNR